MPPADDDFLLQSGSAAPTSAPPPTWPWLHNLKVRIVAGALAALLAGIALTSWHMGRVAEANLLELEASRSHEEVQRLASVVGHRVAELQRALRLAASQVGRESLRHPEELMDHFSDQVVLRSLFASLNVADAEGNVRFVVEATGTRSPAISVLDRDYFRRSVETLRPSISAPVASRLSGEPVVVFAQPLVDALGLWGVLSGTMHLNARDLIEDLAETRNNDDDTLIVITDDEGRILAHPQRARLLHDLSDEPRLADVARQWREDGRPLQRNAGQWRSTGDVAAMAGEPATGWHVWRVTSRDDLLAPLRAGKAGAAAVAAAFALAMAGLLLAFLMHQLRPLSRLQQHAEALMRGDDSGEWPLATGEVGALVRALRHLWAERAQVERFNAQVLQRLTSVMAASPIGLAFSREQRFELVSTQCCRLLGWAEQDLLGQPMGMIFAAPADYPELRRQAHEAFAASQPYAGEWKLRTATGRDFWARIRARPVLEGSPEAGSIWSLSDIDEQVAARTTLQHEALHDALTGVLNRKGFERELQAAWDHPVQTGHAASIVMIDLDHFKPVNDLGGHAAGDAMLKAVAEAIGHRIRGSDSVARLGGDEFAVVLLGCNEARATEIAEKIHQGIREIVLPWSDTDFRIGASLGVAEREPAHESPAQWLAAADAACYEAKAAGRDRVRGRTARTAIRLVAPAR